ncbi:MULTISPECIES: hypothetical protein [Niastella]|uniref:Cytochrome b561 bacterial/Ni-hydrogenase domain-containing protein n=1 Tax=Niastella soli TaxID=2821487 RepID=A0ABS3YUQ7_9BACT|nr:hypothetical protein [Niastella soli]MBO9201267.1 hypothetical protein [Niastella soli]
MNTLSYIIYLLLTWFITVHVGLIFYRNGKGYILNLLHGEEKLTLFINRTLLTGYYLLNLGYVTITIRFWKPVHTWTEVVSSICTMTGKIMCILAIIHFCNMAILLFISHRHENTNTNNKNIIL